MKTRSAIQLLKPPGYPRQIFSRYRAFALMALTLLVLLLLPGKATAFITTFDPTQFSSYSTTRDTSAATVTAFNGGRAVHFTGTFWKKYPCAYTVTPNTILSFTINSTTAAAIIGVGMDDGNLTRGKLRLFQLGGSTDFAAVSLAILIKPVYNAGQGNVTYNIPIGTYYTGPQSYLTMVGQSSFGANVTLSNVQVFEQPSVITFDPTQFNSYSTTRDTTTATVSAFNDRKSLHFTGTFWKKYPYPYTITPYTVLSFTINSTNAAAIIGVGLDSDNFTRGRLRLFQLGGSTDFVSAGLAIAVKPVYVAGQGDTTYNLPIGTYYTGAQSYLTMVGQSTAGTNVTISNVRVFENPPAYDVVVNEGTASGVMAAVAAARQGHSVLLLERHNHVGGMVSGGLTDTDFGNPVTVGGLAIEYFNRVLQYYTTTYGAGSAQVKACKFGKRAEPHVAELVMDQMLAEQKVTVIKGLRFNLQTPNAITQDADGNITTITVEDLLHGGTKTFAGKVFIDASYEGDLIAAAHVPYRYGREAISEYGEFLAGVRVPGPDFGTADNRIMSYNYRTCLTNVVSNRNLFPKPLNYDPTPYLGFAKGIRNGSYPYFNTLISGGTDPNGKFCTNGGDYPGASNGYVEGDWATRDALAQKNKDYYLSELYYLQHDTQSLSASFYADAQNWGFPKDEFKDTDGFPFQMYIREARRMVGSYLLTETDATQNRYKPDGVTSGSYGVDCHIIQRLLINGKSFVDHTPHVALSPYDIPYGCLTPSATAGLPGNLLVSVCISATHVPYCSIRMEPVYMMLGHAAGDAAHLALTYNESVQQVDPTELRAELASEGAFLNSGYAPPVAITWSPLHPQLRQTVQFKLVTTSPLLSPLTRYTWDFEGTGAGSSVNQLTPTRAFPLNKIYNVSLVAQDQAGHRKLVTVQVPVGTAAAHDVTVNDFSPATTRTGTWNGTYPTIATNSSIPDVFMGPGVSVTLPGSTAQVRYQPTNLAPGHYLLCMGYRPLSNLSSHVTVTINSASGVSQVAVNEQAASTSPFPFFSLGKFQFTGNGSEYVDINNSGNINEVTLTNGFRWVWVGN